MGVIYEGDCREVLRGIEDESIDLVCTDPPYGYSLMGLDWDNAVPGVEVWAECLRVLKPGGFAFVMSAPRSDVQMRMIGNLEAAGFRTDFTPLYWTYATGFPKAKHVGRYLDKVAGAEREVIGHVERKTSGFPGGGQLVAPMLGGPVTEEAKRFEGAYAGYQPKPAVEVIIVAMKPLSAAGFIAQALENGKGITWLDDCRVPGREATQVQGQSTTDGHGSGSQVPDHPDGKIYPADLGRFPSNLLISDAVLSRRLSYETVDGRVVEAVEDERSHVSRFFSLDAWAETLPFLIVPKPSAAEKDLGCEEFSPTSITGGGGTNNTEDDVCGKFGSIKAPRRNSHPTVKPLQLMSYLITLATREGDTVLDPFVGSGTTVVAAKHLGRFGVGIERDPEYAEIARARIDAVPEPEPRLF